MIHTKLILSGIIAGFIFAAGLPTPVSGQTIIELWNQVKAPAAPEIKPVVLEATKTMLLLLDFNKQVCNNERRPRCIASIPVVEKLTLRARNVKVPIAYSLSAGAVIGDVAPQLAAKPGERSVISGPDKFLGPILKISLKQAA